MPERRAGGASLRTCSYFLKQGKPTRKEKDMPTEPIGRLDHVAIAVNSIDQARTFIEGSLGAKFRYVAEGRGGGFRYAVFDLHDFTIELIEAIEPKNFVASFIERRGEGVHHITLQVPGLREKIAFLEGQGLKVVDKREEGSRTLEAFLSPKTACGVLFQLAEEQPALNNEPYWKKEEKS
jgi:methylmalonyl-CoA epimerase